MLTVRGENITLEAESFFNVTAADYLTLTTHVMTISARELTLESLRFLDIQVMSSPLRL